MCVCVCVCVSLSVFMDGWPRKGSHLQHLLPALECLRGSPLFIYFGTKGTQKAVPV